MTVHEQRMGTSMARSAAGDQSLSTEVLPGGIVAPLTTLTVGRDGRPGTFDGGAYRADGSVCLRSLQRKSGFQNEPAPLGPLSDIPQVAGNHLFGGMLKNEHFGHFLVESLGRLWALNSATPKPRSVVFYTRMPNQPVPAWATDFLSLFGDDTPVTIVSRPTSFETLIVPDQVAHPSNGYIHGHPVVRDWLAVLRDIPARPFKSLYISRSKLIIEGGFFGERALEEILAREGFEIIHPQEHSLCEQFALYNGADRVVFAEGSAVHTFALVCRPDQKVYIIQRRRHAEVFSWQLRSFGLTPIIGPRAPSSYLIQQRHGRDPMLAKIRIDFDMLRGQMVAGGFVSGVGWDLPTTAAIDREISEMEDRLGQKLVEHPASAL